VGNHICLFLRISSTAISRWFIATTWWIQSSAVAVCGQIIWLIEVCPILYLVIKSNDLKTKVCKIYKIFPLMKCIEKY
jgi:hypothetical protein